MSPEGSIAHYRVVSKIGEGGMGAVYRATDTKLARDVAIKVIPDMFAADPDRLARFTREAQVLASLNHPNIAAIHGVEDRALILELVEGPTLAERIAEGPIPIDEALPIAKQIAEALEYAHEKAIVHRDLKPANIKVTPEGRVKVLDFGLAKALASDAMSSDPGSSPTMTMRATMAGLIMGTAAYMAPEQAKGKPVDRRADIWSFGVVITEMLTGNQMYTGETASEVLASVIKDTPDLNALPEGTPSYLRRLLQRCLERDPRFRLQSIGEARVVLERPPDEATPSTAIGAAAIAAPKRQALPWIVAGALAAGLAATGWIAWRATRPEEKPLLRFSADMGSEAIAASRITAAISPDGTRLAYPVRNGGNVQLATRLMEQSKETVLSGTDGAQDPFFSPDGQWIGFFADSHLKKVSVQGGAPTTLCEESSVRGAEWGDDGYIVYGGVGNGLKRVPATGGTPQGISKAENGDTSQRWPQILPGGEAIVFTGHTSPTAFDDASIEVLDRKTEKIKIVQRGGYFGRYLPSGHLVYLHQSTLFAVPFDLGRNEVHGMPVPVLEDVAGNTNTAGGQLAFSRTGTLVYLSGKSNAVNRTIIVVDSAGKKETIQFGAQILNPRISPDGKRLALSLNGEIAVYDFARGATTRIPSNAAGINSGIVWTPDGQHIVYSPGVGGIWWARADGSGQPQRIYEQPNGSAYAGSFTPDGRYLAFHQASVTNSRDLWILPLDTSDPDHPKAGTPESFLATKGADVEPAFSPDGKWLAYSSSESGVYQVFVRPFPEGAKGGGQAQISTRPSRYPIWSRTAKEIFYVAMDGHIMVAPYTINGRTFEPGKPRQWSASPITLTGNYPPWDLMPDAKRIVAFPAADIPEGAEKVNLHLTFLLNFFDELKRKVPVAGR